MVMLKWSYFLQRLHQKRGDAGILFIFVIAIFGLVMIFIVSDFLNIMNKANIIKSSMNRAVKAAAMQIDVNSTNDAGDALLANGVFLIDEAKARTTFNEIIAENLGLSTLSLAPEAVSVLRTAPEVLEFEVINDYEHMPLEYRSSTLSKEFTVEHPSVYAVISFKVQGLLLQKDVKLGKLSSAQLLNKQDLR